jgi:NhaA family Na+:H+ antiporter
MGILLAFCAIISMILANSVWGSQYISFWQRPVHFPGWNNLPHSFLHWINDFLMSIFFFMVGMEIKRELLEGELRDFKKAIIPIFAAIGGMVFPACIYFLVCGGTPFSGGWGIPMATDIAFSLGIASLLGARVPVSLKIFLTALAIIDDLGAIIMIAVFYGGTIHWKHLLLSLVILAGLLLMVKFRKHFPFFQFLMALVLWYLVYNSGIQATVAGVLFAFTSPGDQLSDLERRLHVPVNFFILPVFALANTAMIIHPDIAVALSHPVNIGIVLGLFLGKPLGITFFCFLLVKLNLGKLPSNINWLQLLGTGMLAGIGFTMSIFITILAFKDTSLQDQAKIGVFFGSFLSMIAGSILLLFFSKKLTSR